MTIARDAGFWAALAAQRKALIAMAVIAARDIHASPVSYDVGRGMLTRQNSCDIVLTPVT
jgi:hypothetical protein